MQDLQFITRVPFPWPAGRRGEHWWCPDSCVCVAECQGRYGEAGWLFSIELSRVQLSLEGVTGDGWVGGWGVEGGGGRGGGGGGELLQKTT